MERNNIIPTASLSWLRSACADDKLHHPHLAHFQQGAGLAWGEFSELLAHFARHNCVDELRGLGARAWQHFPLYQQSLLIPYLARHRGSPGRFFITIFGKLGLLASHYPLAFNARAEGDGIINIKISHPAALKPCEPFITVLLGMVEHCTSLTLKGSVISEETSPGSLDMRISDARAGGQAAATWRGGHGLPRLPREHGTPGDPAALPQTLAVAGPDEQIHSLLLNSVSEAVLTFAADGRVRYFNAAAAFLFGPGMATGANLSDHLPLPPDGPGLASAFASPFATRWNGYLRDGPGRARPVTISLSHAGETGICMVLDRTEASRAQLSLDSAKEQLAATQRTSLLGELSRGVIHDFKNLLASFDLIIGQEMGGEVSGQVSGERSGDEFLTELMSAVSYGSDLTGELMSFAGRDAEGVATIDLTDLLNVQSKLLDQLLPDAVTMTTDIHDNLVIKAAQIQVRQILTNLAINARDAMPDGGAIFIRAFQDGGHVVLEVSDTGTGIDPSIRHRIFEPFFTTKTRARKGRGSGVGLALTADIVERHGGSIDVSSVVGDGTTFSVRFPELANKAHS